MGSPRKWRRQPVLPPNQSQTSQLPRGLPGFPCPGSLTLGLALRWVARLLKPFCIGWRFFFFFNFNFSERFAMQGLLDPLLLETLERGISEPAVAGSGVSWTTHCFSPGTTRCHSPKRWLPTPGS